MSSIITITDGVHQTKKIPFYQWHNEAPSTFKLIGRFIFLIKNKKYINLTLQQYHFIKFLHTHK